MTYYKGLQVPLLTMWNGRAPNDDADQHDNHSSLITVFYFYSSLLLRESSLGGCMGIFFRFAMKMDNKALVPIDWNKGYEITNQRLSNL